VDVLVIAYNTVELEIIISDDGSSLSFRFKNIQAWA
jgi:hypothetical protein